MFFSGIAHLWKATVVRPPTVDTEYHNRKALNTCTIIDALDATNALPTGIGVPREPINQPRERI
jgi:hypothetical protein